MEEIILQCSNGVQVDIESLLRMLALEAPWDLSVAKTKNKIKTNKRKQKRNRLLVTLVPSHWLTPSSGCWHRRNSGRSKKSIWDIAVYNAVAWWPWPSRTIEGLRSQKLCSPWLRNASLFVGSDTTNWITLCVVWCHLKKKMKTFTKKKEDAAMMITFSTVEKRSKRTPKSSLIKCRLRAIRILMAREKWTDLFLALTLPLWLHFFSLIVGLYLV